MISFYYLPLISLFNINNFITNKETIKPIKEFSNYEYKVKYENFFKKINKPFLIVPNLVDYKVEFLRVICFNFWDKFHLKNTRLDLDNKKIKEVPKEIQSLTNLKYLLLENNKITVIPKEIQFLTNLTTLYLDNNKITVIPKEIQLLTNLHYLYLDNNQIKKIPTEIQFLTNLKYLLARYNKIRYMPKKLEHMKDIIKL